MMAGILQDVASGKVVLFWRLKWFNPCSAILIMVVVVAMLSSFDENAAAAAKQKKTYQLKII